MGADAAAANSQQWRILSSGPKVFRKAGWLFGFTSSFRMGQLIQHQLVMPAADYTDLPRWLATDFVAALRDLFSVAGYAKKENNVEEGGQFLLAPDGFARLFSVESDYHIMEHTGRGYAACGCGQDFALGSLHTSAMINLSLAEARVKKALEAAAEFSAYVRPPWTILHTRDIGK